MLWWLCSSFLTSDALIQAPAICTCLEGKCWPSIPRRDTNRAHFNVNNPPWRGSMINVSFSCHGLIPNLGDTAFHCKLLSQDLDPVLPCKPCIFSYRNLNFSFSDLSTPLLQTCQPPDTLVCSFQRAAGADSTPSSITEVLHCPPADPAVVPARPPAKHWEQVLMLSNTQRLPPARKQTITASTWGLTLHGRREQIKRAAAAATPLTFCSLYSSSTCPDSFRWLSQADTSRRLYVFSSGWVSEEGSLGRRMENCMHVFSSVSCWMGENETKQNKKWRQEPEIAAEYETQPFSEQENLFAWFL